MTELQNRQIPHPVNGGGLAAGDSTGYRGRSTPHAAGIYRGYHGCSSSKTSPATR